jgi:hypothetical protein
MDKAPDFHLPPRTKTAETPAFSLSKKGRKRDFFVHFEFDNYPLGGSAVLPSLFTDAAELVLVAFCRLVSVPHSRQ